MKPIAFNEVHDFQTITIKGIRGLFTNNRIYGTTLPKKAHKYAIRSGDSTDFATLEPNVTINHMGDFITFDKIDFSQKDYIEINDDYNFTDERPEDYLNAHQ